MLATEFLLGIVCVREQLPAWGVLAVLLLVYTTPWKERGMRKVLFAAGLPGMFLLGMLQMQRQIDFRQQYLQKLTDGQEVRLAGKIDRIEPKTRCVYYYLKDCTVEAESQTLPCNDVIAYVSSASHSAGQILNIEGTISLFTEASNEHKAHGASDINVFIRLVSEGLLLLLLVTPIAFIIDYNLANMELNSWRNGTTLEWGRLLLCAAISFVLIGLMIAIGISIPARKAMKVQPAEALHDE